MFALIHKLSMLKKFSPSKFFLLFVILAQLNSSSSFVRSTILVVSANVGSNSQITPDSILACKKLNT